MYVVCTALVCVHICLVTRTLHMCVHVICTRIRSCYCYIVVVCAVSDWFCLSLLTKENNFDN